MDDPTSISAPLEVSSLFLFTILLLINTQPSNELKTYTRPSLDPNPSNATFSPPPWPHLSLCWLTWSVDLWLLTQRRDNKERVGSECFESSPSTVNLAVHMETMHIQVLLSSALAQLSLPPVPYRATREGSNHLLIEEIAEPAMSYVVYLISVGES